MERMGPSWWLWAWGVTTAFSLFAAWIYPTVLAPLFNKFTPLPDGELKDAILDLARRTGFRAGGISVMDASRRTAHGNAYFTGVFGQKRIVLFDTLLEAMGPREVVAVLAHELGHFKLHHVRWGIAPRHRDERPRLLRAEPLPAARGLLRGLLPRADRLRRARGLRPLVRPGELPAAAARERPLAPARVRGRRLRAAVRRDRRPSSGPRSASSARRAGTCPSPTRSTRGSTTRTRRSSSGCGRWGRSRAPEAGAQPRRAPRLLPEREDRVAHAVLVGAEAQDAEAEGVAAADAGAGEEDAPARVHPAQQLGPEALGLFFRRRAGGRPRPRAAARRASRSAGRRASLS